MKKSLLVFLAATVLAVAVPPKDFDARVEALKYSVGVSGMAVTIVEAGKTTFAFDSNVKVEAVTMKPISLIADFSRGYQDLSFIPAKGSK